MLARASLLTVLDSSFPVSMMRRQSGMISVCSRKLITLESSIYWAHTHEHSEHRTRTGMRRGDYHG